MSELFFTILNMSLTASYVILFVIFVRLLLKKAPKVISYALWAVVAFHLIIPFSVESMFSLMPRNTNAVPIPHDIIYQQSPQINSGIEVFDSFVSKSLPAPAIGASVNPLQIYVEIGAYIWFLGIIVLLVYSLVSILILKRQLKGAELIEKNIYEAKNLKTPFVLGLIRPKIYLPVGLNIEERSYILLHEQTHIHRKDHIIKIFAFLILSIHWFNPLVWMAFMLMSTDMELSCDERVLQEINEDIKNPYANTLLSLATGRYIVNGSPLAFGEGNVKGRIKNVLNYKKPRFWVTITAIAILLTSCIILLTNPVSKQTILMGANYQVDTILYDTDIGEIGDITSYPEYCITADYHLYGRAAVSEGWDYIGAFEPYSLSNNEFEKYSAFKDGWTTGYRLSEVTDSYILRLENEYFYLAFQTKSDDTLLGFGWEDIGERGQGASDDTSIYRLYKLKTEFKTHSINSNFFDRSLVHAVDAFVNCFHFFESDDIPGYMIVGFMAGESEILSEMTDMGFAVFQSTGVGYKLLNYHVYTNAALSENGIYFCEHPAVADVNGISTAANTYDVILSYNKDLATITRIIRSEGKEDKKLTLSVDSLHSMTMFRWKDEVGSETVEQYFYDKSGQQIVLTNDGEATDTNLKTDDIAKFVEDNLNVIMSSPKTSSNPQDYINAHKNEYESFFKYGGEDALKYMLTQFKAGNPEGLRGQIMMQLCKELLGARNNVTDDSLSPQEWYDALSIRQEVILPNYEYDGQDTIEKLVYDTEIEMDSASNKRGGFIIVAPKVFGNYEEEDMLKVFVTTYSARYKLFGNALSKEGGSIIPAAITYRKDDSGRYILEEYEQARDGSEFGPSIREYCTMPVSGKEIKGLADKIFKHYTDYGDIRTLLYDNLYKHLKKNGIIDATLTNSRGEVEFYMSNPKYEP
jgi:beta-lactamase regulating signal transducer with metallopeptidase domain